MQSMKSEVSRHRDTSDFGGPGNAFPQLPYPTETAAWACRTL
jgi:hypothetical protein